MIPGCIATVAQHCTLNRQSMVPGYVSALQDWVLRAFAPIHSRRRGADFSLNLLLCAKMVGLF